MQRFNETLRNKQRRVNIIYVALGIEWNLYMKKNLNFLGMKITYIQFFFIKNSEYNKINVEIICLI